MIALISGHYLRSKVCIEELCVGIALQHRGTAKVWPILIEPLAEDLSWLKLIQPVECFEEPFQQECPSLSGLCKNILKDIHHGKINLSSCVIYIIYINVLGAHTYSLSRKF